MIPELVTKEPVNIHEPMWAERALTTIELHSGDRIKPELPPLEGQAWILASILRASLGWGLGRWFSRSWFLALLCLLPKNPSFGWSNSGSAISALTPHITVVSPSRTNAEPLAVDIEPRESIYISIRLDYIGVIRTYIHSNFSWFIKFTTIRAYSFREESLEVHPRMKPTEGRHF